MRWRAFPSNAATEFSPSRHGVSRPIAGSDHRRCVSTLRWALAFSKVTPINQRLITSAGIDAAASSGRVEKQALGLNRPSEARTRTQRIGSGSNPE